MRRPTLSRCLSRPSATGKRPRWGRPEGLYLGRPYWGGPPNTRQGPELSQPRRNARPRPGPPNRSGCSHHRPGSHAGHGLPTRCSTGKVPPKLAPPPRVPPPRPASRKGHERQSKEGRGDGPTWLRQCQRERRGRLCSSRGGPQDSTASLAKPCPKAAAATPPPRRRLLQLLGGGDCRYLCGYPSSAALAPPSGGVGPLQTVPGARSGGERWAWESLRRNLSAAVGSEVKTSLSPL